MSREQNIRHILGSELQPSELSIVNESHMHSGPATESHFKLVCVSEAFIGLSRVKRHQSVYALLDAEFEAGMHALALHLYSPDEWRARQVVQDSPLCANAAKS